MQNQSNKSKIIFQVLLASFIAAFIAAGIVGATTTIGSNITTGGTLTATGLTTLGNASTTQISVSSNIYTALTANSIPYIAASGLLTEDTANFIWDSTNNRLGIGTSSPYARLSVVGQTVAEYFTATSTTATSTILGGFNIDLGGFVYDFSSDNIWMNNGNVGIGTTSPTLPLSVSDDGTNSAYFSGRVGIGTNGPGYNLDVSGTGNFSGNLSVGSLSTPYSNTVTVAKSGGDYTTITAALNAITDASATNRYAVYIYPGEYDEEVTMKEYVDFIGIDRESVIIHPTTGEKDAITTANNTILKNLTASGSMAILVTVATTDLLIDNVHTISTTDGIWFGDSSNNQDI
jgi:hypothetical protein